MYIQFFSLYKKIVLNKGTIRYDVQKRMENVTVCDNWRWGI